MPGAMPSGRFRFARRFIIEIVVISVSVMAGVSLANWRGVPDRFANTPAMLAQVSDVVGNAITDAIAPAAEEGKTVEIPLAPTGDGRGAGAFASSGSDTRADGSSAPIAQDEPEPYAEETSSAQPAPAADAGPKVCDVHAGGTPTRAVLMNEVAWMGSAVRAGVSATAASADEWIELRNASGGSVDLSGYRLVATDGSPDILLDSAVVLPSGGFALLERSDDDVVPNVAADFVYAGTLANGGEHLKLFNADCELVDAIDGSNGWPAGSNATKQTMERSADGTQWQTSVAAQGTPKAANSAGAATTSAGSEQTYRLTVQVAGTGAGIVQSTDGNIVCGSDCVHAYAPNTPVTLKAYPEAGTAFSGWSSFCAGTGSCGVVMSQDLTIAANFGSVPITVVGVEDDPNDDDEGIGGGGKVFISEIMAGSDGNSDNEFIELYNPTGSDISLTGWTLKKKTSSGSESVLVAVGRFEGKKIPAHGYLLIVHEGLYQGGTPADVTWPTSYNIAYSNNTVLLYDGTGGKVDEVAWTDIPVGQSYARTSWDEVVFEAGAPTPQNSSQ